MFVLLTLTIPRSFYLSEYELMTAVTSGNQTTGIDLFGSVTIYVQRRWNNPPAEVSCTVSTGVTVSFRRVTGLHVM